VDSKAEYTAESSTRNQKLKYSGRLHTGIRLGSVWLLKCQP